MWDIELDVEDCTYDDGLDADIYTCCYEYLVDDDGYYELCADDPGLYTSDYQECACVVIEGLYGAGSDEAVASECDTGVPNYSPECALIAEWWGDD